MSGITTASGAARAGDIFSGCDAAKRPAGDSAADRWAALDSRYERVADASLLRELAGDDAASAR